ncbi:hypothetical protein H1R20_g11172, partial [Candolleomyces eurysporus]
MTPGHHRYHTSWSMGCSPGSGGFYRYRRGPSRILWFIVGAGAASWYIKRHQSGHANSVQWQPSSNGPNQQQYGSTPSVQAPPQPSHYPTQAPPIYQNSQQPPVPQQHPEPPVQVAKAEDSVINQGVSEAMNLAETTLESILGTAQALKLQLADQRAERERQQKEAEKKREEELRTPPRWV